MKVIDTLPDTYERVLWWRSDYGWHIGYMSIIRGVYSVYLDNGSITSLDEYAYWENLPLRPVPLEA